MALREFTGELDPEAKDKPPEAKPAPAPKPAPPIEVKAPSIEGAVQSIDRYAGKADALAQSNYLLLAAIKRLMEKPEAPESEPKRWKFTIERDDNGRMKSIDATRME